MNFDELSAAVKDAKNQLEHLDRVANSLAGMLDGRLRRVNQYYLKRLKRELRYFNMSTGQWK